jgi:hypothetical protein
MTLTVMNRFARRRMTNLLKDEFASQRTKELEKKLDEGVMVW